MGPITKTVLLTGGTGYLGTRILKRLIANGYKVCVIKRSSSNISPLEKISPSILFYNNEIEDIERVFKDNKIDLVIHTATAYGRKGESLDEIKSTNLDFPLHILSAAIENNVNYFINTGTSLPYLTNQYSLFKNQFAECLQYFSKQVNSVNILLEHFYGPEDDDSKFITSLIKKMRENVEEIDLTEGTQIRDFIYIDDVLDAYLQILTDLEKFDGYNEIPLGSGEGITIRSLVEMIKQLSNSTSKLNFGAVAMRANELMKSDADISILNSMGWYPKFTLEEGLNKTIL